MISTELFNSIMGYDDTETLRNIRPHATQVGYIQFSDYSVDEPYECEINKYEFIAHCKRWAMDRDHQISAYRPIVQDDRGAQVINYWFKSYIIKFDIGSFNPPYQIMEFDCNEESEFEAIIKACEWILKEIKFKQLKEDADKIYLNDCLKNMYEVLKEEFGDSNGN